MTRVVQDIPRPGGEVAINAGGVIVSFQGEKTAPFPGQGPAEKTGRRSGGKRAPVCGRRLFEILLLELEDFGPADVLFQRIGARRVGRRRGRDRLISPSRPKDLQLFIEEKIPSTRLARERRRVRRIIGSFQEPEENGGIEGLPLVFEKRVLDRPEGGVGRDGEVRGENPADGFPTLGDRPEAEISEEAGRKDNGQKEEDDRPPSDPNALADDVRPPRRNKRRALQGRFNSSKSRRIIVKGMSKIVSECQLHLPAPPCWNGHGKRA